MCEYSCVHIWCPFSIFKRSQLFSESQPSPENNTWKGPSSVSVWRFHTRNAGTWQLWSWSPSFIMENAFMWSKHIIFVHWMLSDPSRTPQLHPASTPAYPGAHFTTQLGNYGLYSSKSRVLHTGILAIGRWATGKSIQTAWVIYGTTLVCRHGFHYWHIPSGKLT